MSDFILLPRPTDRRGRRLRACERAALKFLRACADFHASPTDANFTTCEIAVASLCEEAREIVRGWDNRRRCGKSRRAAR
jgi:hypothetical protein